MVSHLDHDRDTEALNPSRIPSHVIFLAETTKYHPIPCTDGLGRNPKVPVTTSFAG
jgi:bifunctional DNase/RNase